MSTGATVRRQFLRWVLIGLFLSLAGGPPTSATASSQPGTGGVGTSPFYQTPTPEPPYEIVSLGTDGNRRVDRYQVTLGPGASLWDLGFNRLPLVAIEQGEQKVVETIEQSFKAEYPDRAAGLVKPGDTFVLEVATGTFVSRSVDRKPDRVVFESYAGDRLTTFPRDPVVQYRLQRADQPGQVEVLINGGQANAVDEAKKIYDVERPDFLQVREVRAALQERTKRITLDTTRKYLDDFRQVRDRAERIEDTPQGLKAYFFKADDLDIPYVRVDDSVGDETDPANFTRIFRITFHRDGTVRRYVITEAGDSMSALAQPNSAVWRQTLPSWQEWLPGQPETMQPFAPAVSSAGALLPGRILVLAFRPRITAPSPAAGVGGRRSGVECAGLPLGIVLLGSVLAARRRPNT